MTRPESTESGGGHHSYFSGSDAVAFISGRQGSAAAVGQLAAQDCCYWTTDSSAGPVCNMWFSLWFIISSLHWTNTRKISLETTTTGPGQGSNTWWQWRQQVDGTTTDRSCWQENLQKKRKWRRSRNSFYLWKSLKKTCDVGSFGSDSCFNMCRCLVFGLSSWYSPQRCS